MNIYQDNEIVAKIREIEARASSGILTLHCDSQRVYMVFWEGRIESISSNLEEERLGRHLLAWMDVDQLHKLLADANKLRRPLGESAVRSGLVKEPLVIEALGQQASNLFSQVVQGGFEVHAFSAFEDRQGPGRGRNRPFQIVAPIGLDWLVLNAARRRARPLVVLPTQRAAVHEDQDFSRFDWYPQELAVLGKIREYPRTLAELIDETGLEAAFICKILNVLSQVGAISLHEVPEPGTEALMKPARLPLEVLIPKVNNPTLNGTLEVLQHPFSFATEQFRTLKVRLRELLEQDHQRKVVSVTSPHSEDGKSLVSANLAFCLADDLDQRVCLVDCDFRKPSVHLLLGMEIEPGLTNLLLEEKALPPHCFMRRVGNLYTMTAGPQPENPVELLSLQRMRELTHYLRAEFDVVIFDCPPNLPIADAQLVSHHADAILLVVRQAKTPYAALEKAMRGIDPEKFLGVVFNDVKAQPFHTYYDYSYYNAGSSGYVGARPKRLKEPGILRPYFDQ